MTNDNYQSGPSADNYGVGVPPPELPPTSDDSEMAYERERPTHERPAYEQSAHERVMPERHQPPSYVRWIGGCLIAFVVLFVLCGGTTAVLAAMAFNRTPASASFDKSFSVSGVPTLVIHGSAGSVHVNAGGNGQVSIHANKSVHALTQSQAQSQLDGITITATQSGNVVNIRVDDPDNRPWFFYAFQRGQVDLTVTAPANTNLAITEDAGSVDASGFTGKLTARIDAGSATLNDMTMAKGSSLTVDAGSLRVDGALQPDASLYLEVGAGSADITLPQNTSAHLNATASAGSVNVNGWNVSENHDAADMTAVGDLNPNPTGVITIRVDAGSATLNAA